MLTREITVLDPRTGETVGRVPIATPQEGERALRRARARRRRLGPHPRRRTGRRAARRRVGRPGRRRRARRPHRARDRQAVRRRAGRGRRRDRHAGAVRRAGARAPRAHPARRLGRHRLHGARAARRRRRADPVERPGRRRRRACSAPRWSPATPSCTSPASAAPHTGRRFAELLARPCPRACWRSSTATARWVPQLAGADVDVVAHVGVYRDRARDRARVRPHRGEGACWRTAATTR